jgi:MtN3 and saliva related transmembrane protein
MSESFVPILGYIAATCTTISFLPQVIQTVKTRRTKDISLEMYLVLLAGALLWMWYGFLLQSPPIYLANIIVSGLCAVMLVMKIKHG